VSHNSNVNFRTRELGKIKLLPQKIDEILKWVNERMKNEEIAKGKLKESKEKLASMKEHQGALTRALQGASIRIPV